MFLDRACKLLLIMDQFVDRAPILLDAHTKSTHHTQGARNVHGVPRVSWPIDQPIDSLVHIDTLQKLRAVMLGQINSAIHQSKKLKIKFGSPLANPRPGLDNGPQRNFTLPSTQPLNEIAAIVKLTRSKRGGWLLKSTILVKQLVHAQGYIGDRFDCERMPLSRQNLYRFGDFKPLHVGDV